MSEVGLVALLGALHVLAFAGAVGLLALALRSTERDQPPGDEPNPGGDGGSRRPPPRPSGGPPLADATPARRRRRGPSKPIGTTMPRSRRGAREHEPPPRVPTET